MRRRVSRIFWTTAFISQRRHGFPVATRYAITCSARQPSARFRKTQALVEFSVRALGTKANEVIGRTGANVVARAASFLLLADSRASLEIEGEKPPRRRLERWGRTVLQAGKNPLTLDEIVRLHTVLIEDTRFTSAGLRPDGIFLGERDHEGDPLPEFIGARPENLLPLMQGMIAANERMREGELDSVLQAAATAFGLSTSIRSRTATGVSTAA